jgi:calcineurin-like phosphoesterase family protein
MNKNLLKLNTVDQNIFFLSDTHFSHRNICRGTTHWSDIDDTRNFDSLEDMDNCIIDNINKYVRENDILFHLGDFSFFGHENIKKFRQKIICKNIHLLYGNHDMNLKKNKPFEDGSFPQDLFSSCQDYLEINVDKINICLFHYPIFVINNEHDKNNKTIHCFAHCHGKLKPFRRNRLDIGIDNIFKLTGDYKPVSFKEVMELINTQNNQLTV